MCNRIKYFFKREVMKMSKKLFTKDEVQILCKNKYVKKVSSKGITYTDKFKKIFITQNELGKFTRQIFIELLQAENELLKS